MRWGQAALGVLVLLLILTWCELSGPVEGSTCWGTSWRYVESLFMEHEVIHWERALGSMNCYTKGGEDLSFHSFVHLVIIECLCVADSALHSPHSLAFSFRTLLTGHNYIYYLLHRKALNTVGSQ